jgi:hypothetical protein
MILKTAEFNVILENIGNTMRVKHNYENSDSIMFDGKYIYMFNNLIGVFHPFEQKEIKGMVKASSFINLIKKIKEEEFELVVSDNELKVNTKKVKSGFPFNPNLSDIEVDFECQYKKVPEGLAEGLYLCSFSTAKDDYKSLNFICINDLFIYSTDNYRISCYYMNKGLDKRNNIYIYANCASILNSYKNIEKYAIDNKFIYLQNDDNSIVAMRIGSIDNFPDCINLLKDIDKKNVIELPDNLLDALGTAGLFIDSDNEGKKKVTVEFNGKKIKLKSSSVSGWIDIGLRCDSNLKTAFIINADFFAEILKLTNKVIIHEHKALFETDKFSHLVALYTKTKDE